MLKNKVVKKSIRKQKKKPELTQINLLNSWLGLWDQDKHGLQIKKNYEDLFPTDLVLKLEIEGKKLNL